LQNPKDTGDLGIKRAPQATAAGTSSKLDKSVLIGTFLTRPAVAKSLTYTDWDPCRAPSATAAVIREQQALSQY
jgi:hypothetical protein